MANIGALLGLRVLVVGLGKEGEAVANYLADQRITVTATDMKTEADLGEAKTRLETAGVSLTLGQHTSLFLMQTPSKDSALRLRSRQHFPLVLVFASCPEWTSTVR